MAVGVIIVLVFISRKYAGKKEKLSPEVKVKNSEAAKLYKRAKKGDGEAAYNLYLLGKKNLTVKGFNQKYKNYWEFLEKAARLGYPMAQYEYGNSKLYSEGAVGVPYLEKAAEAGVIEACRTLVRLYDTIAMGINYDGIVPPDKKTCLDLKAKWLKVVAESGDTDAQASLGYLLLNDFEDKRGALEWFEKAADKGDPHALVGAARIYMDRGGYEKALKYLKRAAEQDYSGGQYWLGRFYLEEYAFDKEKALFYLHKSAEKGEISSVPAMDFLSKLYENGEVVEADPEKAEYWRGAIDTAWKNFRKKDAAIEEKAKKDLSED